MRPEFNMKGSLLFMGVPNMHITNATWRMAAKDCADFHNIFTYLLHNSHCSSLPIYHLHNSHCSSLPIYHLHNSHCSSLPIYHLHIRSCCSINSNKKLSYRQETARYAVSFKTMGNVAQMFVELHSKNLSTGEWPLRSFKVTGNWTNWWVIWHFLLMVCSDNTSILHHFWDTITFTVYMTEQLELKAHGWFPSHVYTHRS